MKTTKNRLAKDPLDRDLSALLSDKASWKPLSLFFDTEMKKKDSALTIRLSEDLLMLIKKQAKKQKIDVQKLVRKILMEKLAEAA